MSGRFPTIAEAAPASPPPERAPFFRKTKWTPDEDERLIASVCHFGTGNWTSVAQGVPGRKGKQCRERWVNQISPNLSREVWTAQEDAMLLQQHSFHGNAWSRISQFLPGRSSNSVKNRWAWLTRHAALPPEPAGRERSLLPPVSAVMGLAQREPPAQGGVYLRAPVFEHSLR
jgi:hypothetical protein